MYLLIKLIDKVKGLVLNNNYLKNIFDFSSFTIAKLGGISHIFICIFGCLFDNAIAFYGDYLIIYYKLKEKYSRLAK